MTTTTTTTDLLFARSYLDLGDLRAEIDRALESEGRGLDALLQRYDATAAKRMIALFVMDCILQANDQPPQGGDA